MIHPKFSQLSMFACEVLRIVDEGQVISIEAVCDNIEQGTIVEFVKTQFGFKNINVTPDTIPDVNSVLKEKYVSENEARNRGISNSGLIFLAHLIIEDLTSLLYNLKFNDISPESYRG